MARLLSTTLVLLAALLCSADARYPGNAMAPAPDMGPKLPKADLTFIIPADTANFTQEGTLVLTGVSKTTAFSAKKGESGIYPTSYFTSVAPGSKFVSAAGKWLDAPQAALFGASNPGNNQSVVLLTLGSPSYDPEGRTLSFTYQYLAPAESSLKYAYGAVGHVVKEAQMGNGFNVIGEILPGMSMNGAALFIDSNTMALQPNAETKTWWAPWWGGYNSCWNCGYNYGYNNGYYNNGGGYYNNNNNNNNGWGGGYNNNNNNNNGRH